MKASSKTKGLTKRKSAAVRKRKSGRAEKEMEEPSYASRAIDAMLDHAMGDSNPDYDWLVDPFV